MTAFVEVKNSQHWFVLYCCIKFCIIFSSFRYSAMFVQVVYVCSSHTRMPYYRSQWVTRNCNFSGRCVVTSILFCKSTPSNAGIMGQRNTVVVKYIKSVYLQSILDHIDASIIYKTRQCNAWCSFSSGSNPTGTNHCFKT